jgi:hypothetical protein
MRLSPSRAPGPLQILVDVPRFTARAAVIARAFARLYATRHVAVADADAYYRIDSDALLVRLEVEPVGPETRRVLQAWAADLAIALIDLNELDRDDYRRLVKRVLPHYAIRRRGLDHLPAELERLASALLAGPGQDGPSAT